MGTKLVTSKISGREISQAQYITELVCSRRYKTEEKTDAKAGFWRESSFWTKEYKNQITRANALLRMYDFSVITKVLGQESWMYSLYNKSLEQKLLSEQTIYDKKNRVLLSKETVEVKENSNFKTKQFGKKKQKNNLNKLRDLE